MRSPKRRARIVAKNPYVKLIYTTVGGGSTGADPFMGGGAAEVRKAALTLNLTPRAERTACRKQVVEQQLRDALVAIPGARMNVGFGGSNEKYTLVLAGEDGTVLAERRAGWSRNCARCTASATSPRRRAWCAPS